MIKKSDIGKKKFVIPILTVGGIITGISYLFMQFYLAWFCLIPLFYVLEKAITKQSFLYCLLYGVITASILFYWVIPVATRYSSVFTFYSILCYGIAVIYFSLYFALFGIGYRFLHNRSKSIILAGVSIAAFYVLLELVKMMLLPGLPWFHYNLAITQAQNLMIIQWAAVGGFYIIIFTIVFFNYLLTQFLISKDIILLKTAVITIIIFLGGGFLLNINNDETVEDKFKTVLLNENIPAETRWNDHTGDSLANVFFKLNQDAGQFDPDIIIWSESAIPWKFEPNDEFIPKVISVTQSSKADHLIGILSPSKQNANLFILMSNDAWFENTPMQEQHFYITRMEAVMAGKDVIVNRNRGIIGIIRKSGL